uniref:Acetylcholinesterase n=1 Tax=Angiostrongylus cantonensis TaxID=6313 RepID=A0A0K0DNN5_ANGCA
MQLFYLFKSSSIDLIYLHDGSPLFGEEVMSPNGKRLTQFLGVPFAEPPIGNLRFRKPKPKQPWRIPLNATIPPNSCIQSFDTYFGEFYGATMWNANTPTSEDCLYMNIFVPGKVDPKKRLAVMLWVYGGGFWSGTSTLDVYDGRILPVEENIILVSMNYRVSMFGFLYLGRREAPGNMGLWDQQLALKWGNKLFRISDGISCASAAKTLMRIIQRAIIQSGSATAPWAIEPRDVALARTVVLYNAMKCGNMSLQNPDYDKILDCFQRADADLIRENEWAPVREFADFPWVPVVDGDFLVESAQTSLRQGNFKHTQLLAGSNLDESMYFIIYQLTNIFPVQDFFTKKDFVPDRHTWLKAISDLLPRQMIKSQLALAAILHEYEPANLPGM